MLMFKDNISLDSQNFVLCCAPVEIFMFGQLLSFCKIVSCNTHTLMCSEWSTVERRAPGWPPKMGNGMRPGPWKLPDHALLFLTVLTFTTISFLLFFTLLPTNSPHTHTYSLVLTGLDFLFRKLYYVYFFSVILPSLNPIPLKIF